MLEVPTLDTNVGRAGAETAPIAKPEATAGKQTAVEHGHGPVVNASPGGKDPLGNKENRLSVYFQDMVQVANELAPQFTPLGLQFRPQILLATALQEAANSNPLGTISFDGGMGIMQITPYRGKLDPGVAKALNWDNSQSVEYNLQHSKWNQAAANLRAGAETMLGKARSIRTYVPKVWEAMTEQQRWRAVLYAYNAGEGSAINALRAGGPDAKMISTFTYQGRQVSHDYTAELNQKLDYVDSHDPFSGGAGGAVANNGGAQAPASTAPSSSPASAPATKPKPKTPTGYRAAPELAEVKHGHAVIQFGMAGESVKFVQQHVGAPADGEFGPITEADLRRFQGDHGLDPDGVVGSKTIAAMEAKPKPAQQPSATPVARGIGSDGAGSGGGTTGEKPPPAGGSAVAIASHFIGLPSWSPKLRDGIRGNGWAYNNAGRVTDNCAEFVSSVLRMAGEISFQNANVMGLERQLVAAGWKYRASAKESKPGDVWIHESNPQHAVLVVTAGGGETVGSDGSGTEIIKREPMPYPGAKYLYRG